MADLVLALTLAVLVTLVNVSLEDAFSKFRRTYLSKIANNHLFTSHASKGQFEMARSKVNDNYFKTKLTKYCFIAFIPLRYQTKEQQVLQFQKIHWKNVLH